VKLFFLGMFIACLLLPVGLFLYLRFGYVPVAVNGPVIPFEQFLAGAAVEAKIAKEAPAKAAIPASEENLVAGAKLYREHCVECHGLPGSQKTLSAKGMFPDPPQFFERKVMGNDPVGQNYWVVANGIRLSGMPGYKESFTEEQMWQVSQFLSNRGKLPESAAAVINQPGAILNPSLGAGGVPAGASGPEHR
jgi:mono/diheme cytochrome c family protein